MEENKNEIDIREELLSLDEPPAPITWLLGGDDEKMERIAEHVFTLATYYLEDMHSLEFFPDGHKTLCDGEPVRGLLDVQ